MRFDEFNEPKVGDILEVEIGDEIVETVIVGITESGDYLCETDSDTGMSLLESRSDWDSNMPGYQGDYGGAENWGRREREDDEHHEIDRQREQQLAQYNQTGNFWLKYKDSGKHISDQPYTGKAAANAAALLMIRSNPEVKGNLLITAYGPGEVREAKQRLDPKCWDGYKKQGTKMKGGVRVNNCVPESAEQGVEEGSDHSLKQVWDRYSKHLQAGRGDHSDIRQINKSGKILQDIRKYVKDHHGQKAVDDMERYAERRQWDEGYTVTRGIDKERYQARDGLEGPFSTKSGKVVYYDKAEGKYYDPDTDMYIEYADWQAMNEAEYQGRKVPLGKPMQGDVAKSKVYVKNPQGNVVKVNFGDKNMRIKKSNPGRRKNFRARHNCENPGPRHKARYWSCRAW